MGNHYFIVLFLLLVISFIPATTAAQSGTECNPIQETEICIQEVSLSKTTVDVGNRTEIILKVQNIGNQTGDAAILLGIRQPEGGYDYNRVEEIHNLESGGTQTVSIPLPFSEPVGVHELNVMIFDQAEQHLYDSSGYYQKVTVEQGDSSFDPVGWFISLGTIAQSTLAIISLVFFVLTGKLVRP
jgi:hypothetical protein